MPIQTPIAGKRIDWARVIADLGERGYSLQRIGEECGLPESNAKPWASKLKNGIAQQPRFHEGALLLGLWAQAMERDATTAPEAHA
jgi:hypothetical protein